MDYLIVATLSLLLSIFSFFTGFGLGTILLACFMVLFPIEVAIGTAGCIHMVNNVFRLLLVGRAAHWSIVLKFIVPAMISAVSGALLLKYIIHTPPLLKYTWMNHHFSVQWIKLIIAFVMLCCGLLALDPRYKTLSFSTKWVPFGGLLSGFTAGLCGIQGAFRSAFLVRLGLDTEAFIGTCVLCSVLVDAARLAIYREAFFTHGVPLGLSHHPVSFMLVGSVAAIMGSIIGYFLSQRITVLTIQVFINQMLLLCAFILGAGFI